MSNAGTQAGADDKDVHMPSFEGRTAGFPIEEIFLR